MRAIATMRAGARGPEAAGAGAESVHAALARAAGEIAAAGCETPRLDAEVLLAHVLGCGRERLLIDAPMELGARERARLAQLVRRRADEREPVAYIIGRRAFRGIELLADARALVPRPETELLVEAALALPQRASVLDLGTGGGAVALALASERPDLRVSASDVSAEALELARANARRLGLEVRLLQADLLEGLQDEFDAILANLPYVGELESATLAPEIVLHEPPSALYGGPDGLAPIRALARELATRRRVRTVALEVGAGQARAVGGLLGEAGFHEVRVLRDLAGIERVLVGEGGGA
jgi:release factor glutamine methyltransferase